MLSQIVTNVSKIKQWTIDYEGPSSLFIKVRLRWFWADLVKAQYLCQLSRDLNVLYIK